MCVADAALSCPRHTVGWSPTKKVPACRGTDCGQWWGPRRSQRYGWPYSLSLGAGSITVLQFVGYIKVTVQVNVGCWANQNAQRPLKTDAVLMDDVVVIGYGVQRKKEVTGSIAQIDSKANHRCAHPQF